MANIEKIDLRKGESIFISANGSSEICANIRESGGRLIIDAPMNENSKAIIIERDLKIVSNED